MGTKCDAILEYETVEGKTERPTLSGGGRRARASWQSCPLGTCCPALAQEGWGYGYPTGHE